VIKHCRIHHVQGDGIRVDGRSLGTVSDCEIYGNTRKAVNLSKDAGTVLDNPRVENTIAPKVLLNLGFWVLVGAILAAIFAPSWNLAWGGVGSNVRILMGAMVGAIGHWLVLGKVE